MCAFNDTAQVRSSSRKEESMQATAVNPGLSRRLGANARAMVRMSSPDERVTATVILLPRARRDAIIHSLREANCRILYEIQSQNAVGVEMPVRLLDRLARLDGVHSVEVEECLQPS
jgi:hypothetical protein